MTTLEIYLIAHFVCAVVIVSLHLYRFKTLTIQELVAGLIFSWILSLFFLLPHKIILDIRPKGEK